MIALEGGHSGPAFNRDTTISDLLLEGDTRKALLANKRALIEGKQTDPWRLVYAGLAWGHAARAPRHNLVSPSGIPRLFGEVACRREGSRDPYADLLKLLSNIGGLPTAAGIVDALGCLVRET